MSLHTCNLPHRYIICNLSSPPREVKIARLCSSPVLWGAGRGQQGEGKGAGGECQSQGPAKPLLPSSQGDGRRNAAKRKWHHSITLKLLRGAGEAVLEWPTLSYDIGSTTLPQSKVSLKFWTHVLLLWLKRAKLERQVLMQVERDEAAFPDMELVPSRAKAKSC